MNAQKLIQLFDKAAQELKWPKIVFKTETLVGDFKIKFSRASERSRNPGGLHIVANDIFVGSVLRDGTVKFMHPVVGDNLKYEIEKFVSNPIEQAAIRGKTYNHCCFCGRELTDSRSVFYGYGPICADNWGLPWDDAMEVKKEQEEQNLEDKMKELLK